MCVWLLGGLQRALPESAASTCSLQARIQRRSCERLSWDRSARASLAASGECHSSGWQLGEPTQRPCRFGKPDSNWVNTVMRVRSSVASREPMRIPCEYKRACDEWVNDEYQQSPAPINRREQCHAYHQGSAYGLSDEYTAALSPNHVNAFVPGVGSTRSKLLQRRAYRHGDAWVAVGGRPSAACGSC